MTKQPPAPPKSPPPPPGGSGRAKTKSFVVAPWTGHGEGEKIVLYGPSGMGKTTLASMAPDPVFIGCDDGGRKIVNPKTGEPVLHIPGIDTFGDVRDALRSDVFDDHQTIVIDTGTELQHWALPYMFATIRHEGGSTVSSIEGYGYGKGYRHWFDLMHSVLADIDRLVRKGKNVIILCQEATMQETNVAGENYAKAGPDLFHTDKNSIRNDWISWTDHVFRITWENAVVDSKKKKISLVTGRMISTHPDASFFAKSRGSKFADAPAVSFESPSDDSLWQILFGGE